MKTSRSDVFDSTVWIGRLAQFFANSCNSSFANDGLMLDRNSYRATAEELLFNKKLPSVLDYSKSSFVVDRIPVTEDIDDSYGTKKHWSASHCRIFDTLVINNWFNGYICLTSHEL